MGFPGGSDSKESVCNAGNLGSIPGLGRSPGEGNAYLFQYSCLDNYVDCIVHRITKSKTQLSEELCLIPGLEDNLEKQKATDSNILSWRIPWIV